MRVGIALPLLLLAAGCSSASGPSRPQSTRAVREISSGGDVSCAVAADSTAWCWGKGFGPKPVQWAPAEKFRWVSVALAFGTSYVCGITGDHRTLCQGSVLVDYDASWDLGSAPTELANDTAADTLTTGGSHFCGVTSGHQAWCWGEYAAGDRGDSIVPGTRAEYAVPTKVAGGYTWASIAAGMSHSCGLTTSRVVYCWGTAHLVGITDSSAYDQNDSECGLSYLGGAPCAYYPLQLATVPAAQSITSGGGTTCAMTTVNTVWCWGYVGPAGTEASQPPAEMPIPITVSAVTVGSGGGYCVLSTAGDAYCGNLGTTPSLIAGGLRYLSISTGSDHACGVGVGNYLYCWGSNGSGQLGVGDSTARATPIQVVIPDSTS